MKKIKDFLDEEKIPLILITLFFVFEVMIFCGHNAYFFVDFGREAIIPKGILQGQVLYKDIWNIYGPLAYFINALAYFVFGINLKSLYIIGILNAFIFICSFYFLTREFLSKSLSATIVGFTIFVCMFNVTLFNFLSPYSYACVYGITSYCISALLIIRYIKTNNENLAVLSFLSAGFAFANKFEFIVLFFILSFVILYLKPLNNQGKFKSLCAYFVFPAICTFILLIQGLTIQNILFTIKKLIEYTQIASVIGFQRSIGFYFNLNLFIHNIIPFLAVLVFCFLSFKIFFSKYSKNFAVKFLFYLISLCIATIFAGLNPYMFALFPLSLFLLFLVKVKSIYKITENFVLFLLIFGISLRTFFSLNITLYGQYTLPWIILGLSCIIINHYNYFTDKNIKISKFIKYIIILLLISNVFWVYIQRFQCNYPIETPRGKIYVWNSCGNDIYNLMEYLKKGNNSEKLLVLPEGALVNFLLNKNPYYMYYSLINDYIPLFSQESIISNINKSKYVVELKISMEFQQIKMLEQAIMVKQYLYQIDH